MNYDLEQLRKRCLAPIDDYLIEGLLYASDGGKGREQYVHRNGGHKVLAVAHLDTVQDLHHFHEVVIDGELYVLNAQLDDRLGAHIILDILPALGIECDILLTVGEERGQSTARVFAAEHDYNWMFMFDRSGTDVVGYDYECERWKSLLKANDFHPSSGSYSCIQELTHLGVWGFNFGTAYYHNHDRMSCANLAQLARQIARFEKFYWKYRDEKFEYDPLESTFRRYSKSAGYYSAEDFEMDWYEKQLKSQHYTDHRAGKGNGVKTTYEYADPGLDNIWEALDEKEAEEAEKRARQAVEDAGGKPYRDEVDCPICQNTVPSYEYFFSHDMCLDCYTEIREALEDEVADSQKVTDFMDKLDAQEAKLLVLPAPAAVAKDPYTLEQFMEEEENGEDNTAA